MSDLVKNLRPASFKGVPFYVDGADLSVGRRTQVNEYPQRDDASVQDLGRANREWAFEALVVGADYVDQANRLLEALEAFGPGTLVHPWLGTAHVAVKDMARVRFDNALGVARFALSFVNAGQAQSPTAQESTDTATRSAAQGLQTAAVDTFATQFNVSGGQAWVTTQATADVTNVFTTLAKPNLPGLNLLGFADRAATQLQSAIGVLSNPQSLGWAIANYLGVVPYINTVQRYVALSDSLARLAKSNAFSPPSRPTANTPAQAQAYQNTVAVNALTRQVVLAQAVGVCSLVPAITVYDDAIALRNILVAALDAESLLASDAAYTALQSARSAVWQDLTTRMRSSARLIEYTAPDTTPALVLAHQLYQDAGRDLEICTRNAIAHPGFVPAVAIKVLTK